MSFILFLLFGSSNGCIPTSPPGGISIPGSQCCPIGIFDEKSTGMAVFDPALRECPTSAQLICSVAVVGNKMPTTIVINGATEIARGPDGTNTKVKLTCRTTDNTWLYNNNGNDVPVSAISCNNA